VLDSSLMAINILESHAARSLFTPDMTIIQPVEFTAVSVV